MGAQPIQQDTPEWHDLRRKHLGASDAPTVMNVSPWKTPYQLWEEKLGLGKEARPTYATQRGKLQEEPARRAYEEYTNNLVVPEVVFHPTIPYLMASLDGITMDRKIILEVKNPGEKDHKIAKDGKIPKKYWPQVQQQLDCEPQSIVHFWSYFNGEGVLVEVERDSSYIKQLREELSSFWQKVLRLEPPDLTERDKTQFVDEEWFKIKQLGREVADLKSTLKQKEAKFKELAQSKCGERSAEGLGLRYTRIVEKGRVDYDSIPELKDVDLSPYRKAPVIKWRMSFYEEKRRAEAERIPTTFME